MKNKIALYISISVFAVSLCAIAVFAWIRFFPAEKQVVDTPSTPSVSVAEPSSSEQSSEPLPENPIDFTALKERNSDVCGWIKVPGTSVDYAVLRASTQAEDFYLDHNIDRNYEFAGSVYMQKLNLADFSDRHVILYGHNMKNGSMFASLLKYRDPQFFKENRYIYIYTPHSILTYEIFSAYRYDNRHILYSFNFDDDAVYGDYLKTATNPKSAMVNTDKNVTVTTADRIITLSTCITSDDYRYLVQGVLVSEQPTR